MRNDNGQGRGFLIVVRHQQDDAADQGQKEKERRVVIQHMRDGITEDMHIQQNQRG